MSFVPLHSLTAGSKSGFNNVSESPRPFFHKFRTDSGYYAFDVNTGLILALDPAVYHLLDYLPLTEESQAAALATCDAGEREALCAAAVTLKRLTDDLGVFRPVSLRQRMVHPDEVKLHIHEMVGRLNHLVLSVSEQCNLRCSYCSFSGGYANMRVHNQNNMSWDVAQRALDYFLPRVISREAEIGFYGGEPLINLTLIKQVVSYARQQFDWIRFGMTTNGTLLTDEVADYIVGNNIRLLFSIDGPEHIHNSERRFVGGQPSFAKVLANLRRLKERHPEFYSRRVRFNCVLHSQEQASEVVQFFVDNIDIFHQDTISFASVSSGHETYHYDDPSNTVSGGAIQEFRESLFDRYARKAIEGADPKSDRDFAFVRELFDGAFIKLHRRRIRLEGFGESPHSMGACFPGHYRLFVKANGQFTICPGSNDSLNIGDVSAGIDISKVIAIYSKYYDLHNSECRRCWVYMFCPSCYASSVRDTGRFENALNPHYCDEQRSTWADTFQQYATILEKNPKGFGFLDRTTVVGSPIPFIDVPLDVVS
jgi:uncharacterized protein